MAKNHGQLIFQSADKAKAAITDAAKKDIAKLYSDWADEIGKKAEYYKTKTTASSWLQEQNMRQLQAQLTATSKQISNEVYGIAKDSIYKVSDAVVQANNKWLIGLGFPVDGVNSAFVSVPDQTVRRLITGQIYDSGWSLSKSIWSDNEKTLQDIYGIVAKGLAQNMSAYDISKLLETYVNPSRAKQWNLTMPDGVKIYKKAVDYNAQRLVRTLVQHGYQQSFIATTQKNPFIEYYIWRANGSRTCELCAARDGKKYAKDELPMDHPNGMCTMEPYVDDDKLIDRLADWVNNPDGYDSELDEFAKQFGYEPSVKENVKSNQPANTKLSKYFEGKVEESIKTQVAESMKYISKTFDIDASEYINLKFKIEEKRMQGERMYFSSGDKKVHIFQAELKDFLNGEYTTSDIVHEIIHGIEHKAVYKGSLSGDVQAKAMKSFIKEVSKESNIKLTQAEIKNLFGNYATKDKNSEFITMAIQSGFDADGYTNKKSELSKKRKAVYDATIKVLKNKING